MYRKKNDMIVVSASLFNFLGLSLSEYDILHRLQNIGMERVVAIPGEPWGHQKYMVGLFNEYINKVTRYPCIDHSIRVFNSDAKWRAKKPLK